MTEIVKTGGALAVRPDQTEWTPQQAAVLRQSGIGESVTRAELDGFLHLCQRTGLDPFSRQIYLIGRYDKRAGREVYTPQTGIDGYRVVARRAAVKSGGTYGYEDTLWCDESGRWRDVWLMDKPPAAAKVTVIRDGQRFSAVARHSEYVQTNRDGKPIGMWAKMPAGQLAKCTEALALRKAFPHDLSGVYTAEEMAQADNPAPERHLRSVQRGEADPWASQPQTAAEGRDYLHEAREAADADAVRRLWQQAKADGAVPEYLAQIADVGREKAAAGQQPAEGDKAAEGEAVETSPAPYSMTEAAEAEGGISAADAQASAAEAELRAFAAEHGIDDIDRDAEGALGMPLGLAPAAAIRGLLAQLRGTAA